MCEKCNDSGRVACPQIGDGVLCEDNHIGDNCPPGAREDCTIPCDCKPDADGGGDRKKLSVDEIEQVILTNAEPPIEILPDGSAQMKPSRATLESEIDAMRPVVEAAMALLQNRVPGQSVATYFTPETWGQFCAAVEKYEGPSDGMRKAATIASILARSHEDKEAP